MSLAPSPEPPCPASVYMDCVCSGLDILHHLTQSQRYELLVTMEDFEGFHVFARYSSFSVGTEADGYVLSVSGFSDGGAGENHVTYTPTD